VQINTSQFCSEEQHWKSGILRLQTPLLLLKPLQISGLFTYARASSSDVHGAARNRGRQGKSVKMKLLCTYLTLNSLLANVASTSCKCKVVYMCNLNWRMLVNLHNHVRALLLSKYTYVTAGE